MKFKFIHTEDTNGFLSLIHIIVVAIGLTFYVRDVDPWSAVFLLGLNPLMFVLRHVRFERRDDGEPSYLG